MTEQEHGWYVSEFGKMSKIWHPTLDSALDYIRYSLENDPSIVSMQIVNEDGALTLASSAL